MRDHRPDGDALLAARRDVEELLCDPANAHMVEMVLSRGPDGTLRAASHRGSVDFEVDPDGARVLSVSGVDPLAETDPAHLLGLDAELAAGIPAADRNAYPHAHDQVAQFFDSPVAPDLAVVHTAAHRFHGNAGEHGSLGVVQARAPLIAAGPGVPSAGLLDGHARMVDVAPTLCALAGLTPTRARDRWGEPCDGYLRRQDGAPVPALLDGTTAEHVVAFLWDGTNANVLHAAITEGGAPNAAALLARGTGLSGGVLASFPTATLANHHTALTGAHPGHSGVIHNTWFDRRSGETRDLLQLEQMVRARDHVDGSVDTVHAAVHRDRPGAFTATTYEFCDRGADSSTFADLAAGRRVEFPREDDAFDRDEQWYRTSERYRWMSRVDEASRAQAAGTWDGTDGALPAFAWYSFALTDEASHEGGPHSPEARAAIADTDRRMGSVIEAIDRAGALERTSIVMLADHGMQLTDADTTDDLADVLAGAPHAHHLVDGQFLYLAPDRS